MHRGAGVEERTSKTYKMTPFARMSCYSSYALLCSTVLWYPVLCYTIRYALHTGAKSSSHESQHSLLASTPGMPPEASLPHCAIVGMIEVTHALSMEQCVQIWPVRHSV